MKYTSDFFCHNISLNSVLSSLAELLPKCEQMQCQYKCAMSMNETKCYCEEGYEVGRDGKTCQGTETILYYSKTFCSGKIVGKLAFSELYRLGMVVAFKLDFWRTCPMLFLYFLVLFPPMHPFLPWDLIQNVAHFSPEQILVLLL